LRRILNFGHTVGHALESATGYSHFLHGEAVAFGMKAATLLAQRLDMLPMADAMMVLSTIDIYGPIPDVPPDLTAEQLARLTLFDKKTVGGRVHFVLPDKIGSVQIRSGIPAEEVLAAVEAAMDRSTASH
jgi:3-dehydroquinate synthase